VSGLYAGRYQIEREVGRGGMGTVYRALDVMVGDVVALKVLDKSVTGGSDQMEWFRREVRLARRITHPNVARTHDMGEQGGAHYITMEYVEGTTLQDGLRARDEDADDEGGGRRRRQALAPARAARIAASAASPSSASTTSASIPAWRSARRTASRSTASSSTTSSRTGRAGSPAGPPLAPGAPAAGAAAGSEAAPALTASRRASSTC